MTNRAQRCEIHKPAVFGGWEEGRGLACESRTYAILVKTISRAILKKSFALHRLKAMMAWIGVRAGLDGNVVLVGAQAQLCG